MSMVGHIFRGRGCQNAADRSFIRALALRSLFIALAVGVVVGCARCREKEWSEPVNGLRARLFVLPPPTNSSPFCRVFIEMQNVADVANQKRVRFSPDKLVLHVTDCNGKELPAANNPYDGKTPIWEPIALPHAGTVKFQISFPGLGYNPKTDKMIVDVGPLQSWIIPQDDSTYWLSGRLVIEQKDGDHPHLDWHGTLVLPKTEIPKAMK